MPRATRSLINVVETLRMPVLAIWLSAGAAISPAFGQAQKAPDVGYVFPPVLRIGETTSVQLGGYDWTDDLDWFVHDDQVRLDILGPPGDYLLTPPPYWTGPRASTAALPIPREVPASIAVLPTARPGLVRWQVANANGTSSVGTILLSNDTEVLESRSRDLPQTLPSAPIAVSGRLSRLTEVDRYELTATRNGLITVELMARRLGSGFQGAIEIHDRAGRLIADFADTQGLDGSLTFAAEQGEHYVISLHDVDFRGDRSYVYRLKVTEGPRFVTAIPFGGQRGTEQEIEFIGYGLRAGGAELESIREVVRFPSDAELKVFSTTVHTPHGDIEALLPLSDGKEVAAAALGSEPLQPPLAVTGRFEPGRTDERLTWTSAEGDSWSISAESRGIGGSSDVQLTILDPSGKSLLQDDDQPGTFDAKTEFVAASAGTYTAVVRSLSPRRSQLDEVYRLEIRKRMADFLLSMPQAINVPLGRSVSGKITVRRVANWPGPIALTVEGLPHGVHATGDLTIPEGKNELAIAFEAAADADVVSAPIRIVGRGVIDGVEQVREAVAPVGGAALPTTDDERWMTPVLLNVTMAPPFAIKVVDRERQREVHRGTTYLAPLEIVRNDGFTGPLQIAMSARQARDRQGIRGPLLPVGDTETLVLYPCSMPEWLGTDLTRRMNVHGVGAVPDPRGRLRWLTSAADARITMIMEGAILKLACQADEMVARPGETLQIPVAVSRSIKLPLETQVEMLIPEELTGLIETTAISLAPSSDAGTLTVKTQPDARLSGTWSFELRATALEHGKWPVTSFAKATVEFVAN